MMIFPFVADPLVTVSITILNTINIVSVLLFVLIWRRAASPSATPATTSQPATEGLPTPRSATGRSSADSEASHGTDGL
jgi:bile acid:Na+ symporter, BASS family